MSLIIPTPTQVRILGFEDKRKEIERHLTYTDTQVAYQLRRLKQAAYFDAERMQEQVELLEAKKKPCLLKDDLDGMYTLSGLATDLGQFLRCEVESQIVYPQPKIIPWDTIPPDLRGYQEQAKEALLAAKHAAVQMGTGLGKSFIIMHVVKTLGLKATVMAPSTSIADQLFEDFTKYLGKKRVGRFYGGKKESGKLITIAIHASLAKIEPGSEAWNNLSQTQVFVADESHLTPAATLQEVCLGLCANAPYRFFFSGTQVRGDGAELLLKGIIGDIVYTMTVREGVDAGYLAKPLFRMMRMTSDDSYSSSDPNKMTQRHLFYNPKVNLKAAQIANAACTHKNHSVLILVDEIEQFHHLLPHLRHKAAFAYGTLTKENQKYVPEQYRCNDNTQLVKDFNAGKIPILIGTSAISTGTDLKRNGTTIFLMGGKSPIQVPQAVGRSTRLFPEVNKTDCFFIDFDVYNIDTTHRHAEARAAMYDSIYGPTQFI